MQNSGYSSVHKLRARTRRGKNLETHYFLLAKWKGLFYDILKSYPSLRGSLAAQEALKLSPSLPGGDQRAFWVLPLGKYFKRLSPPYLILTQSPREWGSHFQETHWTMHFKLLNLLSDLNPMLSIQLLFQGPLLPDQLKFLHNCDPISGKVGSEPPVCQCKFCRIFINCP